MRTQLGPFISTLAAATLLLASAAPAAPPVLLEAARDLAENVLGPGTVKSVRSTDDGTQILIRWESPTFTRALTVEDAREMMYGEALLATGAILGQLRGIQRIRFTVLRTERMLATGENVRGQGVRITFVPELGGAYTPPAPKQEKKRAPGGGAAAQEI